MISVDSFATCLLPLYLGTLAEVQAFNDHASGSESFQLSSDATVCYGDGGTAKPLFPQQRAIDGMDGSA